MSAKRNKLLYNPHFLEECFALDAPTKAIFHKTSEFFEEKGLAVLKEEDRQCQFYYDWVHYQKKHNMYATLLTPGAYSALDGARFDIRRIAQYTEALSFYSPSHKYSLQVSILGVGPVFMSANETAKQKAVKALADGTLFAFGCSERHSGADLYNNKMALTPQGDGTYKANGNKYYIGNGNLGMVSTLAKNTDTGEFCFFLTDSKHRNYKPVKRISCSCAKAAYVGEYELIEYPVTEDDMLSSGQESLFNALSTVNIGKFMVGFTPIGGCAHALYEAFTHSYNRMLYGRRVTDMSHIRELFLEAYMRFVGIKLYAYRAVDYFRASSEKDRRYLLFNPINKAKVNIEANKVLTNLLDATAAKAYETETYLEMILRDVPGAVRLEGTAHVNLGLSIKFMEKYFFNNEAYEPVPTILEPCDDTNVFHQMHGDMGEITFDDYKKSFQDVNLPNVKLFVEQMEKLRQMFIETPITKSEKIDMKKKDMAALFNIGEMFVMCPFAQLMLEGRKNYFPEDVDDALLNQMFGLYVRDFAQFAFNQLKGYTNDDARKKILLDIAATTPVINQAELDAIWENHLLPLDGAYVMAP